MQLLLGNTTRQSSIFSAGIDIHDFLDSYGKDNWALMLVGVKEINLKPYTTYLEGGDVRVTGKIFPLELSVIIYFDNMVQQDCIDDPFLYIEVNPFEARWLTIQDSIVQFKDFGGMHYGVMVPKREGFSEVPVSGEFKLHETYVLPSLCNVPYFRNFIRRRDLDELIAQVRSQPDSKDGRTRIKSRQEARNRLFNCINQLFQDEDRGQYQKTKGRYLASEDKRLSVFSLDEIFGPKELQQEPRIYQLARYTCGMDKAIKRNVSELNQTLLHLFEYLLGCGGMLPSAKLAGYCLEGKIQPLLAPLISFFIILPLADAIYRTYKFDKRCPNYRSGLIGSIAEYVRGSGRSI